MIAAHDGMVGLRQSREALAARLGSPAKLSSRAERRFLAAIGAADGAADGTAAGATGAAVSAADPMEDPSEDDGDASSEDARRRVPRGSASSGILTTMAPPAKAPPPPYVGRI